MEVTGEFDGDLHCNYNETTGRYAFEVYEGHTRSYGITDDFGCRIINGILYRNYELAKNSQIRAYHPNSLIGFYNTLQDMIGDINYYFNTYVQDKLKVITNNNYNFIYARGELSCKSADEQTYILHITSIGLYCTNNELTPILGLIRGYIEGQSAQIFCNSTNGTITLQFASTTGQSMNIDTTYGAGFSVNVLTSTILV